VSPGPAVAPGAGVAGAGQGREGTLAATGGVPLAVSGAVAAGGAAVARWSQRKIDER
jgi:hypothetical protein